MLVASGACNAKGRGVRPFRLVEGLAARAIPNYDCSMPDRGGRQPEALRRKQLSDASDTMRVCRVADFTSGATYGATRI